MNTSQLTFTRFIAAVAIVFFHYHNDIIFKTNSDFIEILKSNLNLGVSYFYVLSGFVMMLAYGYKSFVQPKEYYINRFARIYPLHILASVLFIIVSILVSIKYLEYYHFPNTSILLEHIFLIQAWVPQNALSLNFPSWSISVEIFFYLCFPFLFNYFLKKYNLKAISIISLLFWIICQILLNLYYISPYYTEVPLPGNNLSLQHTFLYFNPLLHLNQFIIGLLFGKYFIMYYKKIKGTYDIPILIVSFITLVMIYFLKDFFIHNGLLAINFAILIGLISANEGIITKLFRRKFLIYLGEISFAIYLLQAPIYSMVEKIFKTLKVTNPYILFFTFLVILIIASHFAYKYIEIPCKNKIKNTLSK